MPRRQSSSSINTPGGSLDATQRIVSSLLEAPLPTIVWVAPSGGTAASAGTFITLAANLAYMAPGTNIGAASPVGAGGEELEGTIGDKVRNDAIANIRSIAEARGRDVDWAVSTVEKAVSSSALEAVAVGAVDGIATSLEDVRRQADGQVVDVGAVPVTVDIADAPFVDLPMNPFQSIIHLLSDPNIAFILLTLGFYGLLFELQSPNFVTGILGAIALILAFIGFGSLPLNVAGLLLIGLAIVLFVLEFTVTSHGLLTVGGLICFVLGAFALYTAPGIADGARRHGRGAAHRRDGGRDGRVHAPRAGDGRPRPAARSRLRGRLRGGRHDTVPPGSDGFVKTRSRRSASSTRPARSGRRGPSSGRRDRRGAHVRVVGQEGLTLIVEPGPVRRANGQQETT